MDYNQMDASEILEEQDRKSKRNIDAVVHFLYGDKANYRVRNDKKSRGKNDGTKWTKIQNYRKGS